MEIQIYFNSPNNIDAQERISEQILNHMQIEWEWHDLPSDHIAIDMVKMIDYDVYKALDIFQKLGIEFSYKQED